MLELVAEADRPLSLSELAAASTVPVSTASRLTALLVERGYLRRQPSGGYAPGSRLVHLGLSTIRQLHDTRRLDEVTRALAGQIHESVSAGLLIGAEIVLVARTESTHPLRVVARVGDIVAPHISAMGKAILAYLDEQRRRQLIAAAVGPERADEVLTELLPELEAVVQVGYACDEQTYAVGQRCRAVALLDHNGEAFGGLSIAGPAARFSVDAADETVEALREHATALSLGEPTAVAGRAAEPGGATGTGTATTAGASVDAQEVRLPG